MEEVTLTDLDMEVARQLVHLSEGETTTTTTTTATNTAATTSSSGSCNSIFYNFDDDVKLKNIIKNKNRSRNFTIIDGYKSYNYSNGMIRKQQVNNKEKSSLRISSAAALTPVAGELEDEDEDDGYLQRKKVRRSRCILELYSVN